VTYVGLAGLARSRNALSVHAQKELIMTSWTVQLITLLGVALGARWHPL
jgi:hypothetical protein